MLVQRGFAALWCVSVLVALLLPQTQSLEEVVSQTAAECDAHADGDRGPASALLQVSAQKPRRSKLTTLERVEPTRKGRHKRKALTTFETWALAQLALNAPLIESDNASLTETRLEMARRALTIVNEEEQPQAGPKAGPTIDSTMDDVSNSSEGTTADEVEDVVRVKVITSGANAELTEEGYAIVSSICCPLEMSVYTERVITHFGYKVCNEGSLQGLVAWYYCSNQSRSFAELTEEISDAEDGDCAWIGTESACPVMSKNCPHFPDTSGHRRRICGQRHVTDSSEVTPTEAPVATNYTKLANTHCGYYQSCGKTHNALDIGDAGKNYSISDSPSSECTAICDSSPECGGFTFIRTESRNRCYYRRNVTCGTFASDGADCYRKPV